jgi:hypothetical protein
MENYAKLKPFLHEHFRYNFEKKCYEANTGNRRFVEWLFDELRKADFNAKQIGRFTP